MNSFRFLLNLWFLWLIINEATCRRIGLQLDPPGVRALPQDSESQIFKQILDHFDATNLKRFDQVYYQKMEYCGNSTGCPIFLMIGGEAPASPAWMTSGSWNLDARTYNARMFFLEHRYYGLSQPFEDISVHNLRYLSSEQALADIANFIGTMNVKHSFSTKTKWILFGGSYAGSLAAWARMKYPHLVHGAVSSSAPLTAKLDFHDFFEVTRQSLDSVSGSKDCSNAVHDAFLKVENQIKSQSGLNKIKEMFSICDEFKGSTANDKSVLHLVLAAPIFVCVQYEHIQCNINDACKIMTNKTIENSLDRLALYYKQWNAGIGLNDSCMDASYDSMIAEYRQSSLNSSVSNGERQWLYQTCTEFGFYVTSNKPEDIFGSALTLSSFTDQCTDVFGQKFNVENLNENINRINIKYGSTNIQVSRVVFVHGSVDPWYALGITRTSNPQAPAIFIRGTSHCMDRYAPAPGDSPQLTTARLQVSSLIRSWLSLEKNPLGPFSLENLSPANMAQNIGETILKI